MKSVLMLAAGAAALTLAACDRNGAPLFGPAAAMKPVSRLNCPERQGPLRRVSAAPDGQTCSYTDGDGSEVALQIIRTSGDPHMALKPLEASLSTLSGQAAPGGASASGDEGGTPQPAQAADGKSRAAAQTAVSQADQDAAPAAREDDRVDEDVDDHPGHRRGGKDDHVNVDLPGVHVKADGEKADVKVFGMQIQADGDRETAHITHRPRSGLGRSVDIEAGSDGSLVRTEQVGHANFRTTVMWVHDDDRRQFNSVGYVAAGPKTGPLVVAVVKVRGDEKHGIYDNAGKLVRRASRS